MTKSGDKSGHIESFLISMIRSWLGLTATLALAASAQDGGQLYETYCGACHAPNGLGATGGQFPPLAGSEWVKGDPERAIQIVLHGLQGPIEVNGKPFNLLMPPQGAVLPDDQIAAILTYVRASWGNEGGKVSPDMVAKARAATADRSAPWTSPQILKRHPLPKNTSALQNLTSRVYHGKWKKLPDFSKLTAENVEEEHDGILSVTHADRKEHFGIVWEADFIAPKTGSYVFRFACDDGGRVILDDEVMLEVHGIGPMGGGRTQAAKLDLEKGAHPIRIEYYEFTGQEGISLSWTGPGQKTPQQLTDTKLQAARKGPTPIPIEPTDERAAIYRNFIKGTSSRAIGIGFPGGVNLAYSADHLAPELAWTGAFMDGGLHWTNRGVGSQPPAGEKVSTLTSKPAMPENSRFRGYQLDAAGNPTFHSTHGDLKVSDAYRASGATLIRTLSVEGDGTPIPILITDSATNNHVNGTAKVMPQPDGTTITTLSGNMNLTLRDSLDVKIAAPSVLEKGKELFVVLTPGQSATLTYSWK